MINSEVIETLQKHMYNTLREDNLIVRGSNLLPRTLGGWGASYTAVHVRLEDQIDEVFATCMIHSQQYSDLTTLQSKHETYLNLSSDPMFTKTMESNKCTEKEVKICTKKSPSKTVIEYDIKIFGSLNLSLYLSFKHRPRSTGEYLPNTRQASTGSVLA